MLPTLVSLIMFPLFFLVNPGFISMLPEPYQQLANEPWIIIPSVVMTLALTIFVTFLGAMAQTTTTLGALKAANGTERLAFREVVRESLPYFWRVLGLYFLFGTVWMLIVFVFMGLNIGISVLTLGLGSLCMVPLFILIFPVVLVGYSVLELAQAAIISDDARTMNAISKGWQLFRRNILPVTLLMLILYFGISIISGIFMVPIMVPMMLFPLSMDASGEFNTSMLWIFLGLFPVMMMLMMVVQGILMAFFQSAWAVAYLRLNLPSANAPVLIEANA
jgi:hypothetical protein